MPIQKEIISRSNWGAKHKRGVRPARVPAEGVFLHHAATDITGPGASGSQDIAAIRELERIGQARFGYGISYTFPITKAGRVFEGHGIDREGVHTYGYNKTHRAICLVGNHEVSPVTNEQVEAAAWVLAHGFLSGWWKAALFVGVHADVRATACPGRYAKERFGEINFWAKAFVEEAVRPQAPAPVLPDDVPGYAAPAYATMQALADSTGLPWLNSPTPNEPVTEAKMVVMFDRYRQIMEAQPR